MIWDQIGPAHLRPGLPGDDALWGRLAAQHRRLPHLWTPPILQSMIGGSSKSSASPEVAARWRVRGHADGGSVIVRVTVERVSGTNPIEIDLATDPVTVTTTLVCRQAARHTYAAVIAVDGPLSEVTLSASVPAGSAVYDLVDISCSWVTGEGEWLTAEADYTTADEPVSSERVSRLIQGPGQIARARPCAIYGSVSAERGVVNAVTPRDAGSWGIVAPSYVARTYTLDLYLSATGTGAWTVTLGQESWSYATPGWKSETVRLGPGAHLGRITIQSGGSDTASVDTIQLWR